jgi:hypothetical protein
MSLLFDSNVFIYHLNGALGHYGQSLLKQGLAKSIGIYTSHIAVIPAWTAGIQNTRTYSKLPSMALDTRFPAGMTAFVYNDERSAWER